MNGQETPQLNRELNRLPSDKFETGVPRQDSMATPQGLAAGRHPRDEGFDPDRTNCALAAEALADRST